MNILNSGILDLAVTRDSVLWMICHVYSIWKEVKAIKETISASALANANMDICGRKLYVKIVVTLKGFQMSSEVPLLHVKSLQHKAVWK